MQHVSAIGIAGTSRKTYPCHHEQGLLHVDQLVFLVVMLVRLHITQQLDRHQWIVGHDTAMLRASRSASSARRRSSSRAVCFKHGNIGLPQKSEPVRHAFRLLRHHLSMTGRRGV